MPRRWVMSALFLSSYTPLFVLIAIRSIGQSAVIVVSCGVLAVAGLVGITLFLVTATRKPIGDYVLLDVENRDGDVAGYAATYLLPFVTVFSARWQDVVSLAGFIAFLGVIYVRSRLIFINPLLAVLGYHLWRVIPSTAGADSETAGGHWPRYILVRHLNLQAGQTVSAFRTTPELLLFEKDVSDQYGAQEAKQTKQLD
jgi:hypothetical protein